MTADFVLKNTLESLPNTANKNFISKNENRLYFKNVKQSRFIFPFLLLILAFVAFEEVNAGFKEFQFVF